MIALAFYVSCAAVAIGAVLAVLYLRAAPQSLPPGSAGWAVPLVHGVLGAASLAFLVVALVHGVPRTGLGTGGFGATAAGLFALALLLGLGLALAGWRGRRPAGALVGAHAGIAIAGFVVLLALFALQPARVSPAAPDLSAAAPAR